MKQVKPCWRELRIVHEIGRVINAKPVDHVARESCEGMIQPYYLARSPEAPEAFNNQLLAQLRHHRLKPRHACTGEIRIEWLSPLTVEIMFDCREMGSLEVNDSVDKSFISVRRTNRAGNIELIVVFRVTDGQLVRVDSYDRPYIICIELSLLKQVESYIAHTIFVVHLLNLIYVFPFLDDIVIQLVPARHCSEFRTWEFR